METLSPRNHAEEMALFRSEVVGALARQQLSHGELKAELRRLSRQRLRPPGADSTRTYSVTTLERWYYAYRNGGLEHLVPRPRSDKGRALALPEPLRNLLLDIRREHPSASVPLILRTLQADGRLEAGTVSESTLRRLYAEHGLHRRPKNAPVEATTRLRWQAERPGALWHGDVCHGPALTVGKVRLPLRIHALLDDASRYAVALEAHHAERELDMLGLMVGALRRHGPPDSLYLDNGATYRGAVLRVACERLGITLLHAKPHDPQARGKMERFWRTLREGCLDFLGDVSSLHDVNVRLWAFLDAHYHQAPHASLMGRAPAHVFHSAPRPADALDEAALRDALTVHVRRRVRRDTTVPLRGQDWEVGLGFLSGRVVTLGYCLVEPDSPPWLEHDGKRLPLHLVDPTRNARRKRPPLRPEPADSTPSRAIDFDPPRALLDRATGRTPAQEGAR
jgi:transposase InsO family protein